MMEIVKNIAAVLGVILSAASVTTLVSKKVRNPLCRIIVKYSKTDEVASGLTEIKELLEQHLSDYDDFRDRVAKFEDSVAVMNEVNIEFMKTQCRNIIKIIFYKYNDTKVLPLYEKKPLMTIEDLYVNKLHGNSFAALLLSEMSHWDVDYEAAHPAEKED